MKLIVVMMFVCFLGGSVFAQDRKAKPFSLVDLIVESEGVYQLVKINGRAEAKYKILAGNERVELGVQSLPYFSLGKERSATLMQYLEESSASGKFSPGNLCLYFRTKNRRTCCMFYLRNYVADFFTPEVNGPLPLRTILFPKYDALRKDLIWLCKNRYLLKLLKKGELTTEMHHFSPHQIQFLVKVCSDEYIRGLHAYAKSESNGKKLSIIYEFMDYDPANPNKSPLLDEDVVKKLADAIYGNIHEHLMFPEIVPAFEAIKKKMIENGYLTQKDKYLIKAYYTESDVYRSIKYEMGNWLKERILANGDIETLKLFLKRMENRKSLADLVILAELVQSKTFLDGKPEFQDAIMEQFALRKEKNVVWILAPLLKHKDQGLAKRARLIMQELTVYDQGDNPEDWRKWYKEQNE